MNKESLLLLHLTPFFLLKKYVWTAGHQLVDEGYFCRIHVHIRNAIEDADASFYVINVHHELEKNPQ